MAECDNDCSGPLSDMSLEPIPGGIATSGGHIDIVSVWMEKLARGTLCSADFIEYWRQHVPRIYSPELSLNCFHLTYDEEKAQRILYDPLEQFICNGEPQAVFHGLNQISNSPTLCGHIFKVGEPIYSCRDCGTDPTCVLCADCFRNSPHRQHKYKMRTAQGSGYCDCGDSEAWKVDHCCSRHLAGPRGEEQAKTLPSDVAERTRAIFVHMMEYAYFLFTTTEGTMSLPWDLQLRDSDKDSFDLDYMPENYCTLLYDDNDKSHTNELVINTLCGAIKCTQKDAIDIATMIDSEGRSLILCSTYKKCSNMKRIIERRTSRYGFKALKVLVFPSHVLAHQTFALRLLVWLQKILAHSEGFRVLYSEIMLQAEAQDRSILERILMCDTQLWKMVRYHWHHLFITGMLKEYDSKKSFAKMFTKKYIELMKNFITDDLDYSLSVTSLSVQIFTVTTLAHYLISDEDVLTHLLRTFLSECKRKCNDAGKMEFDHHLGSEAKTFERVQYVVFDLKYLLSSKPEQWTPALEKGFLKGFSLQLNLLSWMQGMNSVVRQVGQHLEFEPNWKEALTLHLHVSSVTSLMLEWCSTNKTVLWIAYKCTLKKLNGCYGTEMSHPGVVCELAAHCAACIEYDISSKPVSIYLPLTRMLGGLHLHLGKHELTFESFVNGDDKPTPEQIMEPVLRTQVMVAQAHAGMWRRNGYSLCNQLYFYHHVKCRFEMLDRDTMVLQMGASLIESNEFLIHLLNKFRLMNWAKADVETSSLNNISEEESVRQVIILVEELLRLLIRVVGERWLPGVGKVTEEDCVKHEIIQLLCIEPMAHSALLEKLPEDANHVMLLEHVIEEVAVFRKPIIGNEKGVYELKPEHDFQYNPFFYHYTREEQSKSEEAQCKKRKAAGELECCPPPPLPPFTESFKMVANLLQCDVMLHLMKLILEWANILCASSFSEVQFDLVLHLIGYALHEEERQKREKTETPQLVVFTEQAERWGLINLMETLVGSMKVDSCKNLLTWTLTKYRQVAARTAKTMGETGREVPIDTTKCKLQEEDEEAISKERLVRQEMAKASGAKMMAQMTAMQNSFLKENAELFEAIEKEQGATPSVGGSAAMDVSKVACEIQVALGPNQTPRQVIDQCHTCILCQEDASVSAIGRCLVLPAYVQRSTILCKYRTKRMEQADEGKGVKGGAGYGGGNRTEKGDAKGCNPLYLPADLSCGTLTSTCGHVMHSDCWQKYFDNILANARRRQYRSQTPLSFDINKQEYLCPLCGCIGNTVLPLVPPLGLLSEANDVPPEYLSFEDWLDGLLISLKDKKQLTQPESENGQQDEDATISITRKPTVLSNSLIEMLNLYLQATYTIGLGINPHMEDECVPLMVWQSCCYTLNANEWLLREEGKPLLSHLSSREQYCLMGIVRCAGVLAPALGGIEGHLGQEAQGVHLPRVQPCMLASHALQLLTMLLPSGPHQPDTCILDWDPLGLLIQLLMCLPSLFSLSAPPPVPCGSVQDLYVLHLVVASHIVQVMLTANFDSGEMDNEEEESRCVVDLLHRVRDAAGLTTPDYLKPCNAWKVITEATIPFLRCCALFFHFLTDVPGSRELQEIGGDTFHGLCRYLGLPAECMELFGMTMWQVAERWAEHPRVSSMLGTEERAGVVRHPVVPNQLVTLPADYSELINSVSLFTCPNRHGEDVRTPTMCLVCGEILCSQSLCCQYQLEGQLVGACTNHAYYCGAGVGIFLRIRDCEAFVMAGCTKGCFVSPPYLDDYGETDVGLRRGNRLHLSHDRYHQLQMMWLGHQIPEKIAHVIESSAHRVSMEWYRL